MLSKRSTPSSASPPVWQNREAAFISSSMNHVGHVPMGYLHASRTSLSKVLAALETHGGQLGFNITKGRVVRLAGGDPSEELQRVHRRCPRVALDFDEHVHS